ncbi:MAG: antibiotic biosynthesis monooxygenase [Clostridiales bacterium]|nr:antibiotic biosynthesis monooxygenase [Clostridiales bacterium]
MMIIVHAHIEVKENMAEAFVAVANKCIEATRQEVGNSLYSLYINAENLYQLIIVEEWESKAALDAHMLTPHFREFGTEIESLLAAPLEIKIFEADKL